MNAQQLDYIVDVVTDKNPPLNKRKFCECGCGQVVNNRFAHGHNTRMFSSELCAQIGAANKGRVHTEETKRKIGRANAIALKGIPHTKKHNRNIGKAVSIARMGMIFSDEHKRNMSLANIGRIVTPKWKKNISAGHKKLWANSLQHRVSWWKSTWGNSEYVRKQMIARNRCSINKIETKLLTILQKLYPNEYKFVGDGNVIVAGKCPDFININGQKKIIELYGTYWHRNDNPQDRIDTFSPYGYDTLIIWEKELKNVERVKFRINKFHRRENPYAIH